MYAWQESYKIFLQMISSQQKVQQKQTWDHKIEAMKPKHLRPNNVIRQLHCFPRLDDRFLE